MEKTYIDKLAFIELKDRKILETQSYGKDKWYIPGGKREAGETDQVALIREVKEELLVDLIPETITHYGTFEAQAHGKPEGTMVRMTCYTAANLAKPLEFNEWYQKPEVQTVTAKNWWYLLNRILKEVEDRPMDAESISAVIADRKRLQAEVSKAQAEVKKLQAENEKLQSQIKQDGQKLSSFSSAVQSLRAATQLGWLERRRTLPGIIEKLVNLIQPETK